MEFNKYSDLKSPVKGKFPDVLISKFSQSNLLNKSFNATKVSQSVNSPIMAATSFPSVSPSFLATVDRAFSQLVYV